MITVNTLTFDQFKTLAASRKNVRYHILDANGDVILAAAFDQANATLFTFTCATPITPSSDGWFADSTVVTSVS
jgi:hypothetical protein